MKKTPIQQAAALLAAQSRINPTPAQQAASRENGKKGAEHGRKGGRPVEYRQFNSNGFLRVKRWNPETREYVQIGSFAGPDAVQRAAERIAEDKASGK